MPISQSQTKTCTCLPNHNIQIQYLLIELHCTIQITNSKHDLAERLRSRGPLDELKLVTVRVLNKGNY